MCVVSFIGDQYGQRFSPYVPNTGGGSGIGSAGSSLPSLPPNITIGIPRGEFDALKKEVEFMKQLLIKAKIYDEQTGQKDCEMEEKIKILRAVADAVGVNLDEVFGPRTTT